MRTLLAWTMSWLISALALCACDTTEEPLPTLDSIAGTYALVRVNGGSLPWLVRQDPDEIEQIIDGRLILSADGQYEMRVRRRTESFVPPFISVTSEFVTLGDVQLEGRDLVFEPIPPDTIYSGHIAGRTIDIALEGWTPNLPQEMALSFER